MEPHKSRALPWKKEHVSAKQFTEQSHHSSAFLLLYIADLTDEIVSRVKFINSLPRKKASS